MKIFTVVSSNNINILRQKEKEIIFPKNTEETCLNESSILNLLSYLVKQFLEKLTVWSIKKDSNS